MLPRPPLEPPPSLTPQVPLRSLPQNKPFWDAQICPLKGGLRFGRGVLTASTSRAVGGKDELISPGRVRHRVAEQGSWKQTRVFSGPPAL